MAETKDQYKSNYHLFLKLYIQISNAQKQKGLGTKVGKLRLYRNH